MTAISLRYPDNGEFYEDRSVLRNAVIFTTAQRAYAAKRILKEPLDHLDDFGRAFLSVDSFAQFVVSTEDYVGWLDVLCSWEPGTAHHSLYALLDNVNVVKSTESHLLDRLKSMDAAQFAALCHVPSSKDLKDAGWDNDKVDLTVKMMEAQHKGGIEILEQRATKNRAMITAHNKSKHMLLGMYSVHEHKPVVLLRKSATGYSNQGKGIWMEGTDIDCEIEDIRRRCFDSIQIQVVLNELLRLLLDIRFGEELPPRIWVAESSELPNWVK